MQNFAENPRGRCRTALPSHRRGDDATPFLREEGRPCDAFSFFSCVSFHPATAEETSAWGSRRGRIDYKSPSKPLSNRKKDDCPSCPFCAAPIGCRTPCDDARRRRIPKRRDDISAGKTSPPGRQHTAGLRETCRRIICGSPARFVRRIACFPADLLGRECMLIGSGWFEPDRFRTSREERATAARYTPGFPR